MPRFAFLLSDTVGISGPVISPAKPTSQHSPSAREATLADCVLSIV